MDIEQILTEAEAAVAGAADERALDDIRVRYLGKKGQLTALLKGLGDLDPAERPRAGAAINAAKETVQEWIAGRKASLGSEQLAQALAEEMVDVTLPGRRRPAGGLHPVTQAMQRI
ncbi:MAG TPA: phenylalanine--tRNA ligase subunit alpha, partial [Pseudomonadales bacterium]